MIITSEKGRNAVENFESLLKDKLEEVAKEVEIEEEEKIIFYSISRLFESYVVFREYMIGTYLMFVKCGKRDQLEQLLNGLILLEDKLRGGDK